MTTAAQTDPVLLAIAAELPEPAFSTGDLLDASKGMFSGRLTAMLATLGIDKRHSVLANYPDVVFHGADPRPDTLTADLAVRSARTALAKSGVDPAGIGLVLGVTSSPGRLLPSLVCDVIARMPELPRDCANLAIEYMGCSAMAKVVDTARWYLTAHPGKKVLAVFTEAITPLSPPLDRTGYGHFTEVLPEERQRTVDALHSFLFADASVAMVFGGEGPGPVFGPVANLTNDLPEDTELGTVPDGGSDLPVVLAEHGRRLYTLSPEVTPRGGHYARQTARAALAAPGCALAAPADAVALLLHTGSTRILDSLCAEFGVASDSPQAASSYTVLREYANTLGCSVPLMLAEDTERPAGTGLAIAFGLSFSAGAFTVTFPDGGWRP
ncbi:3-oxoacyl-[acyl-carrier-protein] synthase-3 [Streptomyces griseochromogenes]|uniref:3-oxoacyl-ACP synthase n=1 Tax=Streptomyces griseochromogenes TaxID=68214 RepID=A0A1B1B329_9ACTN|nr:3-oxoacyl-[acyl-carrier-protein] synthase III C-terminal domain-containing protein [Streptomyces griseochromogenes]ANP53152.1 3-oxoacyl-ACP synthase [Streptomyces griseochromogenes]MBP2053840.1 3-oxoacyl-[acyl-carrier-protein] synthase-3 [Streptomyces griseochromogenes]